MWRLSLDTLPCDVLYMIFDYCHAFDLVRLSEVCKRFNDIIKQETLWIRKSKFPVVTNQTSERFRDRCNPLLCLRTKWHVSRNWEQSKYQLNVIIIKEAEDAPRIQLTKDTLWWCCGDKLYSFDREEHTKTGTKYYHMTETVDSNIVTFNARNDRIVTGHKNGSILFLKESRSERKITHDYKIKLAHNKSVSAIDETSTVLLTGSFDQTVKIWANGERVPSVPLETLRIKQQVNSVLADPTATKFAVGSSGATNARHLHIFDLEHCTESVVLEYKQESRRVSAIIGYKFGILGMVWDSPNILLTCGHDVYIRKWDMRTGKCVCSWVDPTDEIMSCIASDHRYSMITGTNCTCKATLWDQRQTNSIQDYFMWTLRSPVYSVCFDSCHLYGATDTHLLELKFSGYANKKNNFDQQVWEERLRTCTVNGYISWFF